MSNVKYITVNMANRRGFPIGKMITIRCDFVMLIQEITESFLILTLINGKKIRILGSCSRLIQSLCGRGSYSEPVKRS